MTPSDLQFAFFFANPPVNLKFDEFSVDLKRKSVFKNNNLDLKTFIFPIPNDVPAEIPRCQISSSDQTFNLTISGARCDINFKYGHQDSVQVFNDILKTTMELFQQENVEINRIGYVTRHIVKHANPDSAIREKFLKFDETNLCEPLIRFVLKTEIKEVTYNDVYQIEVAKQKNFNTGNEDNIILITQDFNTLPDDINIITLSDLNTFVQSIPNKNIQNYIKLISE
ncbi:hypothetical protein C9E88_012725 [Acinetobacter cumulans]|uniref:hypothetical protein n=1 Tax=Acinetobacter cumulans TaxID=2136182 RepID=UPI000D131015|nr:hypothetical protein [Acinetobacter cumulans]QCO22285.1 hypothetical protein C9E88_012725 [Acinetobacter cumulans]